MVYLPTQPNAPAFRPGKLTIGPTRPQETVGPPPPEVTGPPALPVPHPSQPPTDRSNVQPNKSLKTAAVNRSLADRTRGATPQPFPKPASAPPTLHATGQESPNEARAKLTAWTLTHDLSQVIRRSFFGTPQEAHEALEQLKVHARRMLGNSFAGGMIVGAAAEAQHMITTGKDPKNMAVMIGIVAAHAVPALALPLDGTLALIGGATAMKAFGNACQSLQEGNSYDAGVNLSKTLLNLSMGAVAKTESTHARHALEQGKLVSDRVRTFVQGARSAKGNPALLKESLIAVMTQAKTNSFTLKSLLKPREAVMKLAHNTETTGKLNANHHPDPEGHGHAEPHGPGPLATASAHQPVKGKPAAHH